MKLDILAFSAHPDDIEISCGGTIIKQIQLGKNVGIVDLTQGELGTRGSADLRLIESNKASKLLGLSIRENLKMEDGFFDDSKKNKLKIVSAIRKYKPDVVLANSIYDRHPDHGRGSKLVSDSCFLAGLSKVLTFEDNETQNAWRPKTIYHYIQDYYIKPDFIVDISDVINHKIDCIQAYKTQFWDPQSNEPETPISGIEFFDFIKARAREYGRLINTEFAEGFTAEKPLKLTDLTQGI